MAARRPLQRFISIALCLVLSVAVAGCVDEGGGNPDEADIVVASELDLDLTGVHLGRTTCKYRGDDGSQPGLGWECLIWDYGADRTLKLLHVNAQLACDPVFETEVFLRGGDLVITEIPIVDFSSCYCLYDLTYELHDVPATVVRFAVNDGRESPGTESLGGIIDLVNEPSGSLCVSRDHGPWRR